MERQTGLRPLPYIVNDREKPHENNRRTSMQYLVQMRLASSSRPTTSEDGIAFIERLILPTLEKCKALQDEHRILAGGAMAGAVPLVLIVSAESAQELDDLVTRLPIWPVWKPRSLRSRLLKDARAWRATVSSRRPSATTE
jgi:hypothetical protein